MHRYFLALLFEDATKDYSIPFGPDSGAAAEKLADLTQNGGPDGICRAILYSTRRRALVRTLYPASTLKLDAETIQAATEIRNAAEMARKRADFATRFESLKREAGELDMADILFQGSDPDDDDGESENLDAAKIPATPWQDLSIDERRQRLIEEAASLGLSLAPEAPQDATSSPAAASSAQPGAKKAQGAPGAKKAAQEPAKAVEGAADSDSASNAPGTSGDLLGG